MTLYSMPTWMAPKWDTDDMSPEDATEIRALINGIAEYIDGPEFVAKAVGHDALAVAKRDKDLVALRNYARLFPTGANPRDITNAVKTAKLFRNGGLPDITVEQVESHAIVYNGTKGASGSNAKRIWKIALTHPGQGDLIMELILERGIEDPTQILEVLAESKGAPSQPLHQGVL